MLFDDNVIIVVDRLYALDGGGGADEGEAEGSTSGPAGLDPGVSLQALHLDKGVACEVVMEGKFVTGRLGRGGTRDRGSKLFAEAEGNGLQISVEEAQYDGLRFVWLAGEAVSHLYGLIAGRHR